MVCYEVVVSHGRVFGGVSGGLRYGGLNRDVPTCVIHAGKSTI